MARPSCRSGGTFMPALTGWGVLHPTLRSLQHDNDGDTAGTWQGFPPSMCLHSAEPSCLWQLGRNVGMTLSHYRGG